MNAIEQIVGLAHSAGDLPFETFAIGARRGDELIGVVLAGRGGLRGRKGARFVAAGRRERTHAKKASENRFRVAGARRVARKRENKRQDERTDHFGHDEARRRDEP